MKTNRYTIASFIFSAIADVVSSLFWLRAFDRWQNRAGWMYVFAFAASLAAVAGVAGFTGLFFAGRKLIAIAALLLAIVAFALSVATPMPGHIPVP